MSSKNTQIAYAAEYFDGTETFDLGFGYESEEQARAEIIENGGTLDGVRIYLAVSEDGGRTWRDA